VSLWAKLRFWEAQAEGVQARHGRLGEEAAKKFLKTKGLRFLAANFSSTRGEIDLIFRDGDCLVFVEVKTRSRDSWTRPSRAVDERKRLALARTANDYLRLLENPQVRYRFDVVEVLLEEDEIQETRHIEGCFNTSRLRERRKSR
jgi:putative endonuclease